MLRYLQKQPNKVSLPYLMPKTQRKSSLLLCYSHVFSEQFDLDKNRALTSARLKERWVTWPASRLSCLGPGCERRRRYKTIAYMYMRKQKARNSRFQIPYSGLWFRIPILVSRLRIPCFRVVSKKSYPNAGIFTCKHHSMEFKIYDNRRV